MRRTIANLLFFSILIVAGITLATTAVASAAISDNEALRVGGDIKPPLKVKDVKPVYPAAARLARMQGVVILEITVGVDGKVRSPKIIKSLPALDKAAIDAVSQWEYKPTLVNGKATPVILTTSVNFKLD